MKNSRGLTLALRSKNTNQQGSLAYAMSFVFCVHFIKFVNKSKIFQPQSMQFLSRCFPFIYTDGRADFSLKIIYYRERSDLINAQINTVGGRASLEAMSDWWWLLWQINDQIQWEAWHECMPGWTMMRDLISFDCVNWAVLFYTIAPHWALLCTPLPAPWAR